MLLNYPLRANKLADDLESFYHLLLLFALRYHKHDHSAPASVKEVLLTYDQYDFRHGYWIGGKAKFSNVKNGVIPFDLDIDDVFKQLLESLASLFKEHYASKDQAVLKQRYGIPEIKQKPSNVALPAEATNPLPVGSSSKSVFSAFTSAEDTFHFYRKSPAARPSSKLKDHKAIVALISQAILVQDVEADEGKQKGKAGEDLPLATRWTPGDKINEDRFESVDWSITPDHVGSRGSGRVKRTRSVAEEERQKKRSKTSTDGISHRQTRSTNHVHGGGSSLDAHPEEERV